MERVYKFNRQLKRGESYETMLDAIFADEYEITLASDTEQRQGIDRWFKPLRQRHGQPFSIQYKADERASGTGNIFIETVSVDTNDTPGCVISCQAARIIYLLPQKLIAYVCRPSQLRAAIEIWKDIYPIRQAKNETYNTHGICVPIDEIEGCATSVYQLVKVKVK